MARPARSRTPRQPMKAMKGAPLVAAAALAAGIRGSDERKFTKN